MALKKTPTEKADETAKKVTEKKPAAKKTVTKSTKDTKTEKVTKKMTTTSKLDATISVIEAKSKIPAKKTKEEKTNYNPLEEVLTIKAKNDEKIANAASKKEAKKTAKAVKKTIKVISSEKTSGTKEETISPKQQILSKRDEVKENIKKAEAKKFIEKKDNLNKKENEDLSVFGAFIAGYKKIFTYKARSNRFEFWSFCLLNLIFLTFVTAAIYVVSPVRFVSRIDSVSPIYREIFLLIQFLVYLSLLVRRLHDTGRKLWKEFFRPITFSFLLLIGTSLLYNIFFNDLVGFAFEIAFLAFIYYIVKTSIFASYVEEERTDNEYGVAIIPDSNKITKIVCMISIHVILVTFLWGIILSFIF